VFRRELLVLICGGGDEKDLNRERDKNGPHQGLNRDQIQKGLQVWAIRIALVGR